MEVLAKTSEQFADIIRRTTPDDEGLSRRKHQVFVESSTGSAKCSEVFARTSPAWEQASASFPCTLRGSVRAASARENNAYDVFLILPSHF